MKKFLLLILFASIILTSCSNGPAGKLKKALQIIGDESYKGNSYTGKVSGDANITINDNAVVVTYSALGQIATEKGILENLKLRKGGPNHTYRIEGDWRNIDPFAGDGRFELSMSEPGQPCSIDVTIIGEGDWSHYGHLELSAEKCERLNKLLARDTQDEVWGGKIVRSDDLEIGEYFVIQNNLNGKVRSIKYGKVPDYPKYDSTNITYKYDKNGSPIEINFYDSDGILFGAQTYKYDVKGNIIEMHKYDHDYLAYTIFYKYDKKGYLIEKNYYESDNYSTKETYKYDVKGHLIESFNHDIDGSLYSKEIYKYDVEGNIIQYHFPDPKRSYTWVIRYDENGNVVDDITSEGLKRYKYDANGNYMGFISSNGKFETFIDYKYDKNGNWIKRIELGIDEPNIITERFIEYYP